MKAIVLHATGGRRRCDRERPVPELKPGTAILRIAAFGLNRSELFTRQGHSPGVSFPRILGIEAVGEILEADGGFMAGDRVATVMGGMGRDFDGAYADMRASGPQIRKVSTDLPWSILGALPEMLQTAWGALFLGAGASGGRAFLVRGGTTSVGLAATALGREAGAVVCATTRRKAARDVDPSGCAGGGDRQRAWPVICRGGQVRQGPGVSGDDMLLDSLACLAPRGTVCMAGMVGDRWTLDDFEPMVAIPSKARLTTYSGGTADFMATPLVASTRVSQGTLPISIGRVFRWKISLRRID